MTVAERSRHDTGGWGSCWVWLPLGLLLAVSVYSSLTDILEVSFEPALFVPVWAAFLTFRFGHRALSPLLVAAIFLVFNMSVHFDYTRLRLGFLTDAFLVAAFAALAFCRLEASALSEKYLASHWRWTTLLAAAALAVAAMTPRVLSTFIGEAIAIHWDVGAILAALLLAASLRWPGALTSLRDDLARGSAIGRTLMWCFVILFAGGMLVVITFHVSDWLNLFYGFSYAEPWLKALCFVLAATSAVKLRWLLLLLLVAYVGDTALDQFSAALQSPPPSPGPVGDDTVDIITPSAGGPLEALENYHARAVMINGATAAVLGAVVAPYWSNQRVAPLARSASLLLGAVLVLQFVGLPAGSGSDFSFHALSLGGVAFVGGLVWGGRGTIAVPIIIQLCCLLSYAAFGADLRAILSEAARFGAIAFPFAYFGMLARRGKREVTA